MLIELVLVVRSFGSGSERGLSVIREWPFFGSVTHEKRKYRRENVISSKT